MGGKAKPSKYLSSAAKGGGKFNYNGKTAASSGYDPKTGVYSQSVSLSPEEQAIRSRGILGISTGLGNVDAATNWDAAKRSRMSDDIFNPQAREINTATNNAVGDAVNRFGAMGGLNSAGFGRMLSENIYRNQANSLADARSRSNLQTYDVQGRELANALNSLQAHSGAVNNVDNTALGFLNVADGASQQGFSRAQALEASARGNRGFFGSIFNGRV
jgi:hypothetical protein